MAYSKCPACGRAIAKVRVVLVDPDPFMFTPEDLRPPGRLGFLCPHKGCGADLHRGEDPKVDQSATSATGDGAPTPPRRPGALQVMRTILGRFRP